MQAKVNGNEVLISVSKLEALLLYKGLGQALDWIYDNFEGEDKISELHWELYKLVNK